MFDLVFGAITFTACWRTCHSPTMYPVTKSSVYRGWEPKFWWDALGWEFEPRAGAISQFLQLFSLILKNGSFCKAVEINKQDLLYICCLVPCCQGKAGKLSENSLQNPLYKALCHVVSQVVCQSFPRPMYTLSNVPILSIKSSGMLRAFFSLYCLVKNTLSPKVFF